jgi:hypothetical protein
MGRFEQKWAVQNGQVALLARFTNEARRAAQNVGGLIKAQLIYRSQAGEFRRTGGCWLGEPTDFAEFRVDETRELLIAVMIGNQVHTVGKRRVPVAFNGDGIETEAEPIPQIPEKTVVVRLTNADTGEFLFEREFRFTVKPLELAKF